VIAIQNARLFNETKEALERQTATAEILRVISGSPTDVQPVFDAIVRAAVTLCDGRLSTVLRFDGEFLDLAAHYNLPAEGLEAYRRVYPRRVDRATVAGCAILDRTVINVADSRDETTVPPHSRAMAAAAGFRGILAVPMLREGEPIGILNVGRAEPGQFSQAHVDLLKTFADQAVIAIENVRLFNETKEALDQLKAAAEVLQVISSSVADTEPVFDKILESCERLFEGRSVGISLVGEDSAVHLAAYHGANRDELDRHFPVPLSEASGAGAAILQRRVMHYPDVGASSVPEILSRGCRIFGIRSILIAPMLWEGRGIGIIFVGRDAVGEFSEKEIGLLKTFADQAVIAIQNAKLFHEIQEKSHQLEIANQHKSAFLANMSHELRTPLNAVIGFSEMLAARYFGALTDKQAEYVNDIHGSGKHLLSLINDILDLSKIEAGRMELEASEFDLRAALDNALTLVRERAQRGGISVRLETDPALGVLRGDERKVKQVVLNLLSNAVKFTPRGGTIGVVARRANGAAEIAVTDTGVGIAPADQEAIFEAFRQVGTDVTRKREGTGLGLALTRRFVELHGGTIRVESEPGKGSTFTVTLPLGHGE
jgi:signal transduction histidine kinase